MATNTPLKKEPTVLISKTTTHYLILLNRCAGKRNRYTVYKVERNTDMEIIGRELTLGHAKSLCK